MYPLALWVLLEGTAQSLPPVIWALIPYYAVPNRCRGLCWQAGPGLRPALLPGRLDGVLWVLFMFGLEGGRRGE